MRELNKIITVRSEPPETTPRLSDIIQKEKAGQTVSEYLFTAALRGHAKRIFDCVVNRKGQGFWVQAEYGAGKTHFLGTMVDLLVWRDLKVWEALRDNELRSEYSGALSKVKWFPVAFSLLGMGQAGGGDSLMGVFEEQIRESLKAFDPELEPQIKITSAELADHWYEKEATEDEKAAVNSFFSREHKCGPEEFRKKSGPKMFGKELVRSKLPEGRLRGKFKERFDHIYEQITKLGGYDGIIFVVDEFRSWQDRHPAGTPAYAEDEQVLETLAHVLPVQHLNIITLIASQGDMPQKLSGGGQGDRFLPLYLLADRNRGDFGEIVTFRCRELLKGATTDIKDYYDYCRKEYKFIKQANVSQEYFTAIFPFQPRCFDVLRRITQSDVQHNLPTVRSGIRMAWQTLSDKELLKGRRLVVLPDIIRSEEMRKGLLSEHHRDAYQGLLAAIEQLPGLEVGSDEQEQAKRVLECLFFWVLSLPENLRDGLTAQEVAEATWLNDDAIGATAQAEQILEMLLSHGFPVRKEKKTAGGKEFAIYSYYETTSDKDKPVKFFAPLKKKFVSDKKRQDDKWIESLFWQLPDITPEAQEELRVNGGLFAAFAPNDQRTGQEKQTNASPKYQFPHRPAASTRKLYKVAYGGEIVVSDRWRDEFGDDIKNTDQHFRIVYLVNKPGDTDAKITAALKETRVTEAEAKKAGTTMEESIRWRHIEGFAPAAMPDAVKIAAGTQDVWMALGKRWFMREGTKTTPRYSHGGLSLAEAVVPGVMLRRVTEKTAKAELLNLPTVLQAEEDTVAEFPFAVRNAGNCEIEFEVRVANNLGQELFQHRAHTAPATTVKLTASVLARYRETPAREPDPTGTVSAVTLRLRHTDLDGTWRDALDGRASIPVKIIPKPVKFDTDALKGFDEV